MGSDKTNSLNRDNGTYDIAEAEIKAKRETENIINNNNIITSPTSTVSTPSSYLTNGAHTNGTATLDSKKKWPAGKAYFLSKEILMTERTYKRDLEVINSRFRNVLSSKDVESLQPLFELMDSMVQHHSVFLRDLEHRIVLWEGRGTADSHRIGDVMLKNMVVLPVSFYFLFTLSCSLLLSLVLFYSIFFSFSLFFTFTLSCSVLLSFSPFTLLFFILFFIFLLSLFNCQTLFIFTLFLTFRISLVLFLLFYLTFHNFQNFVIFFSTRSTRNTSNLIVTFSST